MTVAESEGRHAAEPTSPVIPYVATRYNYLASDKAHL